MPEGGKREGWISGDRGFEGSESILYDTVMVDTWPYASVKTHRTKQHKEWTKSNVN